MLLHDVCGHFSLRLNIQKSADDGERRTQFMRNIGDKVAAHFINAQTFSHVMRDDHHVTRVRRHHRDVKIQTRLRGVIAAPGKIALKEPVTQTFIGDDIEKRPADHLRSNTEVFGAASIHPVDTPAFAENSNPFGQQGKGFSITNVAVADALGLLFIFTHKRQPQANGKNEYADRADDPHPEDHGAGDVVHPDNHHEDKEEDKRRSKPCTLTAQPRYAFLGPIGVSRAHAGAVPSSADSTLRCRQVARFISLFKRRLIGFGSALRLFGFRRGNAAQRVFSLFCH